MVASEAVGSMPWLNLQVRQFGHLGFLLGDLMPLHRRMSGSDGRLW